MPTIMVRTVQASRRHWKYSLGLAALASAVSIAFGVLIQARKHGLVRDGETLAAGIGLAVILLLGGGLILTLASWQQTYRRLKQAEATKSEMISRITHDARHYLTLMKGKVDVFLLKLERGLKLHPPALQQDFQLLQENAESLDRLIENLNNSEHLNKGAISVSLGSFDLAEVINGTVRNFDGALASRNVRLQFIPGADALPVLADILLVEHVLVNLVHNAIQFTRAGGLVEIRTQLERGGVTTRVRDQGPGIAPDAWERIFEPFVRLQPEVRGSGLGLSNARGFILLMHGQIGVEDSRLGEGTTFYFTLPAARPMPDKGMLA
jgi:signal transduction histidine kinase